MNSLRVLVLKIIKKLHYSKIKNYKNIYYEILKENKLNFIDVGASIQIIQRWKKIDKVNINYYLFEPNSKEAIKLGKNRKFYNEYKVFNYALSNKTEYRDLYITKGIYQSSFLYPNYNFLNKFKDVNRYKIVKKERVKAVQLDQIKIKKPDFIKIDVQGFNYEVLEGSKKTLNKTIGIDIEVDFHQLYKKEFLYGKINEFLDKNKFEFIDFTYLSRWERDKFDNNGQCVFGNALYLKKTDYILKLNKESIIKYIAIVLLYNKFDLAKYVLNKTKKINNKNKIFLQIKKLESISKRSDKVKSVSNALVKLFDLDHNMYLFK